MRTNYHLDHVLVFPKLTIIFTLLLLSITELLAVEQAVVPNTNELRIVTLSPHLTEIVFALGLGDQIVGVSDYSDYPVQASSIKSVASYEGANIAEIIRLRPTHILVWRGGNKDADIEKLSLLNINMHESHITAVNSLITDILKIGDVLNAQKEAKVLVDKMNSILNAVIEKYQNESTTAVYYLSTQPLIGLGNDKWLNSLLSICGIQNIYANSQSAYPQLQMSHIIRSQAKLLIAASKAATSEIGKFWEPYRVVFDAKIVNANPDALHRFTPRAVNEMSRVCDTAYTN